MRNEWHGLCPVCEFCFLSVESISKSYLVGHNSAKDVSYTALEDVLHHHYQDLTS